MIVFLIFGAVNTVMLSKILNDLPRVDSSGKPCANSTVERFTTLLMALSVMVITIVVMYFYCGFAGNCKGSRTSNNMELVFASILFGIALAMAAIGVFIYRENYCVGKKSKSTSLGLVVIDSLVMVVAGIFLGYSIYTSYKK